ncbi:MAG: helix-turn-helix domain-containing protein [Gemmatimonadota bacterium]|nr:helix-turn-helix domain-containing protein [Gemmatimonadota bacterium]
MSYLRIVTGPTVPFLALRADVFARALDARDARFDGVFFVGITTTRVYCRPVCPARVAYRDHRRFFRSAAAAERAGFRPCMRCRPELAPGCAPIDAVPRLARAAAHRIAAGALNGRTVADLARDLGVGERHLRRALEHEIGVSPLGLAQTHRLLLAKQLLADTGLAVTRVAYASGFQSLRRFNAAFREQYRMTPSAVRRAPRARGVEKAPLAEDDAPLRLSLAYRAPFAWDALLAFLRCDAIDGVEIVDGRRYARTIHVEGRSGFVIVEDAALQTDGWRADVRLRAPAPIARRRANTQASHVNVAVSPSLVPALMPLLARLRQLFDLDAEPTVIDAHLAQGGLGALVARRPGVRIPGAIDGFDVALRALLRGRARAGRGMSSRDPARRVAWALGEPLETGIPALSRLAPTAARVADAGSARLKALGIPRRRANAAVAVARLVADGTLRLEPGSDVTATRRALTEITGVGDQVATTIVMRALYWPDAFSVTDRALQRAAEVSTPRELRARGERWRPWRAYAALHLWLEDEAH